MQQKRVPPVLTSREREKIQILNWSVKKVNEEISSLTETALIPKREKIYFLPEFGVVGKNQAE
jgi:hypothetical protein